MAKNRFMKLGGVNGVISKVFTPVKTLVYVAVVIFLSTGIMWWQKVYMSEERVFWGMVGNNLKTSSFTQTSVQKDEFQSVKQVAQTQTAPIRLANGKTTISQGGAYAVTEAIGTPKSDYTRYVELSVAQKTAEGKPIDFSSVKNVWSKSAAQDATTTNGQLYTQAVMSVVPFGNLPAPLSSSLVADMKRNAVYKPKLTKVVHQSGRPVYIYDVTIKADAYITVLKEFGKAYGLNHLEGVDPAQYKSAPDVTVQMLVDGWSHQLKQITYGKGARVENFSAYGSLKPLNTPPADKGIIGTDELQYRLQMLFQPQQG